jgi:hypothetical protein
MGHLIGFGLLALLFCFALLKLRAGAELAMLALLSVFLAIPACNHQTPAPNPLTAIIDCGESVISKCVPQALPDVTTCLGNGGDWQGCLGRLIVPEAICATQAVIACAVRSAGSVAAADAQLNAGNSVSPRIAERARTWTAGYKFRDGTP